MSIPGLFVTGTDTGVGKTFIATAIARALRRQGRTVGVFKPVATGCVRAGEQLLSEDGIRLARATGIDPPAERVVPFCFGAPLAPPVAARLEGKTLAFDQIWRGWVEARTWWAERCDVMVVEGVGGLLCPIAERATAADIAQAMDYPVIIVARRSLGTMNHTMLTCEAARRSGLRIAGVVLNQAEPGQGDPAWRASRNELARWLRPIPILADVDYDEPVDDEVAAMGMVDWSGRALAPRHMPLSSSSPESGCA